MSLTLEHVGLCVADPMAMAVWYRDVLGFELRFSAAAADRAVAFVAAPGSGVCLELGRLPGIRPLTSCLDHPLQLHLAFTSADPDADAARLVAQGARFIEECPVTRPGDRLLLLADPWGNALQLVSRRDAL